MTLHMTPELDTTAEPVSRLPVFDANMCAEDMERMMDNAQRASNFLKAISHEGCPVSGLKVSSHLAEMAKRFTIA